MTTEQSPDASADKYGVALNAQRFKMLEDIAGELAGEVVFPTSFDAVLRLRSELQNSELPTMRIAQIVSLEPLVASKLMRVANSALYSAMGGAARDLQAAIARLGIDVVRTTALAIAMNQLMRSKEMVVFMSLTTALWDHSLKAAAAARILARSYTRVNPDEALLAGLVHDLGAFYMVYRAAQYPELRTRPDTVKYLIAEWHESIGVTLLNALGLSEELVNASIDHDHWRNLPLTVRTLSDIVYVGSALDETHFARSQSWPADDAGLAVREQFAALLPAIDADAREMRAIFN